MRNEIKEEELRHIYPDDAGLLYVQSYMKIFEPNIQEVDLKDLNAILKFYMTRRDAPNFVRETVKTYLKSILGYKDDEEIRFIILNTNDGSAIYLHGLNVHSVELFKFRYSSEYVLAEKIIHEHYEAELEEKKVVHLSKVEIKTVFKKLEKNTDLISWYNKQEDLKYHSSIDKTFDKAQIRNVISKILAKEDCKPKLTINDESIFDDLDASYPNFHQVNRFYKAQFRLLEETRKYRVAPIVLLGSPGIGKSMYTKALAEALKTSLTYVDMASTSSGSILSGLAQLFTDAKNGKIAEAIINSPTINPIVVLDEIEKAGKDNKYDPLAPLYSLLEENTAKEFIDEFIDQPLNCSGIIYIACANSLDGIPEPLLTRLKVFNIPDPTREEKEVICQKIYQQATENSPLFNPILENSLIEGLLEKSLREVKQIISDAVANALLEFSKEELRIMKQTKEVITVEERHFNTYTPKKQKFGF